MSAHFGESPAQRGEALATDRIGTGPAWGLGRRARDVVDGLKFWLGLVVCGSIFLAWSLAAGLTSPLLPARRRRRVGRWVMRRMFSRMLWMLEHAGILHVDSADLDRLTGESALILAPNHPSMLDVLLIIARLDDVCCVMKAALWRNIFLGTGARMAGFIGNDSPRCMIRLAMQDLARGSRLLIFPEATRTVRPPLNPLASGFALIASKSAVPIQTILIETDSPYLSKGWSLFRRPPLPLPVRFRLRLGKRFEPRVPVEALVEDIERYFRAELESRR